MIQTTADEQAISQLKQKLQTSDNKIMKQATDLEKSENALTSLREQYAALEARANTEQTMPVCTHEDDIQQLATIRDDLRTKTDELEALQEESVTKATEAKSLEDDNAQLRVEIESLQQAQANSEQAVDDAVSVAKKEAAETANVFTEQKKIEHDNAVKTVNRARDRLIERMTALEGELESAKKEAASSTDQQEELLRLQKLVNGHETEMQKLQVSTIRPFVSA